MCLTRANKGELILGVAYSVRWSGQSGREGAEAGAWGCWRHCIHSQESGDETQPTGGFPIWAQSVGCFPLWGWACRHSFTSTARDVSLVILGLLKITMTAITLVNSSEVSVPPTHVGWLFHGSTSLQKHMAGNVLTCASSKSEDEEQGQGPWLIHQDRIPSDLISFYQTLPPKDIIVKL